MSLPHATALLNSTPALAGRQNEGSALLAQFRSAVGGQCQVAFENAYPAPDGQRYVGQAAVRSFWGNYSGRRGQVIKGTRGSPERARRSREKRGRPCLRRVAMEPRMRQRHVGHRGASGWRSTDPAPESCSGPRACRPASP